MASASSAAPAPIPPLPKPRRRSIWPLAFWTLGLGLGMSIAYHPVLYHLRASSLLWHLENPDAKGRFVNMGTRAVSVAQSCAWCGRTSRTYTPVGVADPPRMIVLHGVHHLGIDEPRMVNFARSLASQGIEVVTPQLGSLADYSVKANEILVIKSSIDDLYAVSHRKIGVLGLSFAGGLALQAAADPKVSQKVAFVWVIGAHDDMARVSRFFVTNEDPMPNGEVQRIEAHDYGPLVLVYSHTQDFFSGADAPVAREALRLWLWEQPDAARRLLPALSGEGRAKMESLFTHKLQALAPEMLAEIEKTRSEMQAVSPHQDLANMHRPVFLLHGAADDVIPAAETKWLVKDLPSGTVHLELISPAISHVGTQQTTWLDNWRLIHFVAQVLAGAFQRE